MRTSHLAFAAMIGLLVNAAHAQDTDPSAGFKLNPVVLDSNNKSGATVGLEYQFSGKKQLLDLTTNDSGSPVVDPDVAIGTIDLAYQGSGTVAASASRNPMNFLDAQSSLDGSYSGPRTGSMAGGILVKAEADQEFQQTQTLIGGHLTYAKFSVFGQNDFFAVDITYGRIDPGDDQNRKTALGTTELTAYYRWGGEVLYMYPTGWNFIETIELNYRIFYEPNAPTAIRAAHLETHQLGTIRIGLPANLFVAYSVGKLPFDVEDDHILALGFSYKLF